jgi:hypothetical protein
MGHPPGVFLAAGKNPVQASLSIYHRKDNGRPKLAGTSVVMVPRQREDRAQRMQILPVCIRFSTFPGLFGYSRKVAPTSCKASAGRSLSRSRAALAG